MLKFASFVVALAAAANALVVPKVVTSIQTVDSTATTLLLNLNVSFTANVADANTTISFMFGSADGTSTYGTGTLFVDPSVIGDDTTLNNGTASATWSPGQYNSVSASEELLSNFISNFDQRILVSDNSTGVANINTPVVQGVGVDIVKRLDIEPGALTPISGKLTARLEMSNPFNLNLTFENIAAVSSLYQDVNTTLNVGQIDAMGLNFVVPGLGNAASAKIPATTDPTEIRQVLAAFRAANNSLLVNATAVSKIRIGSFEATVKLNKAIRAAISAGP